MRQWMDKQIIGIYRTEIFLSIYAEQVHQFQSSTIYEALE